MLFHVEFFETEDGRIPVKDFLDFLDPKLSAKMIGLMEILEERGTSLSDPEFQYMQGLAFLLC